MWASCWVEELSHTFLPTELVQPFLLDSCEQSPFYPRSLVTRSAFWSTPIGAHSLKINKYVVYLQSPVVSIVTANHIHECLLRIFIALLPQVSLSFINNTARVGSALYLQYMEQCSYFGLEESSHDLKEPFRTDSYYYRSDFWCLCTANDDPEQFVLQFWESWSVANKING